MESVSNAAVSRFLAVHGLGPDVHALAHDLLVAWRGFWAAQLWRSLPAEVGLRLRRANDAQVGCLAVLGQGDAERGFTYAFDAAAFDAFWSGEAGLLDNLTVLAQGEGLEPGLPLPVVLLTQHAQPAPVTFDALVLAVGCLRLLLGVEQHELHLVP